MATIAQGKAIAEFGNLTLSRAPAWMVWPFAHVFFLIGFRKRFRVMLEWTQYYFTFRTGFKLIAGVNIRITLVGSHPRRSTQNEAYRSRFQRDLRSAFSDPPTERATPKSEQPEGSQPQSASHHSLMRGVSLELRSVSARGPSCRGSRGGQADKKCEVGFLADGCRPVHTWIWHRLNADIGYNHRHGRVLMKPFPHIGVRPNVIRTESPLAGRTLPGNVSHRFGPLTAC